MFGGITFAGALFGGVVGIVGPLPAVPLTPGIIINGMDVTARVRVQGVTIRDVLNDAPNTATLTIEGTAPTVGQSVTITVGARALFTGAIQTIDQAFESLPTHIAWHLTAIDDTGRANMRRPFGTFVDTSATAIAQSITTTFAPGFATTGIAAGLPTVTITFDGADTFIACLARLATAVGGYCKIEDRRVYLFVTDPADPPDPIDAAHRFLINPPITLNTDASQLRTRVYGKGYGETVLADLAAGETLIPVPNGANFQPLGGRAIAGTTADGAQSQQISYTSVSRPLGGTLVGTGAAPPNPPGIVLSSGTGLPSGVYDYATVFLTAVGHTIPSPLARAYPGSMQPPAAPTAATVQSGDGPNPGAHLFAVSYVTTGGETPPGPAITATTTAAPLTVPSPPCGAIEFSGTLAGHTGWHLGDTVYFAFGFEGGGGGTPIGTPSVPFIATEDAPPGGGTNHIPRVAYMVCPSSPAAGTALRVYCNVNGAWIGYQVTTAWNSAYYYGGPPTVADAQPPLTNTAVIPMQTVLLSGLSAGSPPGVTARKIWGTAAGGSQFKYIGTINPAVTSYTVTTPDAALGVNAPTGNTVVTDQNRVAVSWAAGPAGVTNIELYRTATGGTVLQKFYTVGSNTTGSITDTTPDAGLGTPAAAGDTSGLSQPVGQVQPGSATLVVASEIPFPATGGWVITGGGQVVRYAGISGRSLIGIPATGPGAIVTTISYGQQATPAPTLTGVTGLAKAMQKGAAVQIWVQRDDTAAQSEHAARTGTDGIVEFLIVDSRRAIDSLTKRCDADLALFSRPILTVQYATRDMKTASGKTVSINLPSPPIVATMIIQEVTITEIGIAPNLAPRYTVKASTVRFSLEDTLRRLIAGGLTSVND